MLTGKVALVTGASQGIGAGIAKVLAKYGADVAVNYQSSQDLAEAVCEHIQSLGQRGYPAQADVMDSQSVNKMIADVEHALGPISILVNNAGHNPVRNILEIKEVDWDWVLNLNLKAYFRCTKAVINGMIERHEGRIISITSISGQRGGLSGDVDYSSAKAGIMGFTKTVAKEYANRGVTVNAVAPGFIETSMTDVLPDTLKEEVRRLIPLGRFGDVNDVANAVLFLVQPDSGYITGQVIHVNGGLYM